MDTFKTFFPVLLIVAAAAVASHQFIDEQRCHEFDSCRSLYPLLDGTSAAHFAMTTSSSNIIDGEAAIISWNASAVMAPSDMNNAAFLKSMCHCDEACSLFGDCCQDASTVYSSTSTARRWSCQPLWKTNAKNDWKVSIYMVAHCPDGASINGHHLNAMCERAVGTENYSHLLDIPVLSLRTNVTYVNVFCAQCNDDSDALASWNFTYRCDQNLDRFNVSIKRVLSAAEYLPGSRKWMYRTKTININCMLVVEQFTDVVGYADSTNARRCIPNVGHCSSDWANKDDNRLCSLYSFYVIDPATNQVYRNRHCARCNGVAENATDYLCKRPSAFSGPFKGRFSFSGVFDFSFGYLDSAHDDRVGIEKRCPSNAIFDHLYARCFAVICGAMYVNRDGACVLNKKLTSHERSSDEFLNSSCPRLNVKAGIDYVLLDNGSIILNKTNEMLHPSDYERSSNDTDTVQICYDEEQQDHYFKYSLVQRHLSDICLSLSVTCLTLHIAIHWAVPKLRNLPGKNLLALACALLVAQLLFLALIDAKEAIGHGACTAVGVLGHWSYLSAFFWMNVMGVDVWRTFVGARSFVLVRHNSNNGRAQRAAFRSYSIYAWGLPSVIVSAGVLVDIGRLSEHYAPRYGEHLCWICNRRGLAVFFVLPVAVLLFVNSILFTLTICSIVEQKRAAKFAVQVNQTYTSSRGTASVHRACCNQSAADATRSTAVLGSGPSADAKQHRKQQMRFVLYLKLALIMGLGWISGFVAALADVQVLWYPFIVFNALQGAFIFVTFDCKAKIYFTLYRRIMKRPHPLDRASSTSTNARTRTTKTSTASQPAVAPSRFIEEQDDSSANTRTD